LKVITTLAFLLAAALLPSEGAAQGAPPEPSLSYESARAIAEEAEAEAVRNAWNVTIVVVDAEGAPLYLKRIGGAGARTVDFALGKARTSAATGLTTLEYTQQVSAGTLTALPDATPIEGGLPILADGRILGAVAVSGLPPQQDAAVARVALEAWGGTP